MKKLNKKSLVLGAVIGGLIVAPKVIKKVKLEKELKNMKFAFKKIGDVMSLVEYTFGSLDTLTGYEITDKDSIKEYTDSLSYDDIKRMKTKPTIYEVSEVLLNIITAISYGESSKTIELKNKEEIESLKFDIERFGIEDYFEFCDLDLGDIILKDGLVSVEPELIAEFNC